MKIHLIKKSTVEQFCKDYPVSAAPFRMWLKNLKRADWNIPTDMRTTYTTADLLGKSSQRVVFDIGGGNYRIICRYRFGKNRVHLFICWIVAYAEYDKINKAGKQYTINLFSHGNIEI